MKLPVFATIGLAFKFFWRHRIQFYFLALPPVVISAVLFTLIGPKTFLNYYSPTLISAGAGEFWSIELVLITLLTTLIIFPLYTVAWHRSYLIPNEKITIGACYRWQHRHWVFLWASLKMLLLLVPVIIGGFFITGITSAAIPPLGIILMPANIAILILCYARFSLWLPASAVDHKMDLPGIWDLTRGNGWRLVGILIFTSIATGVFDKIAGMLITGAANSLSIVGDLTQNLLSNLALFIITYAGMAIGITALSIAYKLLIEQKNREFS